MIDIMSMKDIKWVSGNCQYWLNTETRVMKRRLAEYNDPYNKVGTVKEECIQDKLDRIQERLNAGEITLVIPKNQQPKLKDDIKIPFDDLLRMAHAAGMEAGLNHTPQPMTVQSRVNPFDDDSPVEKEWYVPEGLCGFAWINVKPGNSAFANWLKANTSASTDSYYGGVTLWVHQFNQSWERKKAYAHAFVKVLEENGVKRCWAGNRLD